MDLYDVCMRCNSKASIKWMLQLATDGKHFIVDVESYLPGNEYYYLFSTPFSFLYYSNSIVYSIIIFLYIF